MGCNTSQPAVTAAPKKPAEPKFAYKIVSYVNPTVALQTLMQSPARVTEAGKALQRVVMHETPHHLRNIFATPLDFNNRESYKPPVFEKTERIKAFLRNVVLNHYLFEDLSVKELGPLLDALEPVQKEMGDIIIQQGDAGDYFYILHTGACQFLVNDQKVGTAKPGDSFGELALLYTAPRAATVKALSKALLYRVDQETFRFIMQKQTADASDQKLKLLQGVSFLQQADPAVLSRLAKVMVPKRFTKDEAILTKGTPAESFYLLQQGSWKATHIQITDTITKDAIDIAPGMWLGEMSLVTGEPMRADVSATSDGLAWTISKDQFAQTLGSWKDVILRSVDAKKLATIPFMQESKLHYDVFVSLSRKVQDLTFKKGAQIMVKGDKTQAALFLVREGKIQITDRGFFSFVSSGDTIGTDGMFGEEYLLLDTEEDSKTPDGPVTTPTIVPATFTATALEDCVVGMLTLKSCRKVLNTRMLGKPQEQEGIGTFLDSLVSRKIQLKELKWHKILGAGTFGQVWLVSRDDSYGTKHAYALKVQSKHELWQSGQAKAVVQEKNILADMHSPFVASLLASFKDENLVYMLMNLIQGGELYSVMHSETRDFAPENEATFYIYGIAEGLAYMHRRGYVYRDLKPENVLIDAKGYPVIVDFGFVKYIVNKTYTLCGTPLYLPPEVILTRGHDWGADHWSLGVVLFEMIVGYTPFYEEGMDQSELFRAIVKAKFTMPQDISKDAQSLIRGLLVKDPAKRLGSLAGAEDDILHHAWFKDLDKDKIHIQQETAPHVPKIKDPLDGSHFTDWTHLEDKTKKIYPKLPAEAEKLFEHF